jgi:hypothetical protein
LIGCSVKVFKGSFFWESADEIAKITKPEREYKFMASGVALLEK